MLLPFRRGMARMVKGRGPMLAWISQCVLAARAYGLSILDSVYNDIKDIDGLRAATGIRIGAQTVGAKQLEVLIGEIPDPRGAVSQDDGLVGAPAAAADGLGGAHDRRWRRE